MRYSPRVMRSIFGQMDSDNANIRSIAFEKARDTLAAEGVTFTKLLEAHERCVALDQAAIREAEIRAAKATASASEPPPPPPPRSSPREASHAASAPAPDATASGPNFTARADGDPYTRPNGLARRLHRRRVRFFTMRSDGRRIVRGKQPPRDAVGVLRILKDGIIGQGAYGPRHGMTLSYETDHVLYEPFVVTGEKQEWVRQMHRLSATEQEIIW